MHACVSACLHCVRVCLARDEDVAAVVYGAS